MKNFKILVIIITLIIIIILIALFILIPKLEKQVEENENLDYGDVLTIQQENTYKGYQISSECIEKYIKYNIEKNMEALENILENEEDETQKLDEIYYLKISYIYKIERMNDTTYFVESLINNNENYFIINVDYINNTFNIRKTNEIEFNNSKDDKVNEKYKQNITINKNEYNQINTADLDNDELISKYYYNYIDLALNKPEVAFEILDKDYKMKKFGNDLQKYQQYIENNRNKIFDSTIVEITANSKENYTEFIIQDTFNNCYTIKEYNYTDFTIILDDYTLNTDETEKYIALDSKDKVLYNINIIFKHINNKEYEEVYNKLDEKFKNTNFPTLEQFKNYANETFFDNNVLGNITVEEQGQNYIINVPYKEGTSSVAEKRKKSFVMRLLEDTDFVMSFEIN